MKSFKERMEKIEVDEPVYIPTSDGKSVAEKVNVKVPAWRDPIDGEIYLDDEAQQILDKVKARHLGLLLPAQFKELRRRYGLTQAQIARLFQIGAKSWTRWESGRERPSRSLNLLLRAVYDGQLELGYLHSIQPSSDPVLKLRILRQREETTSKAMRGWSSKLSSGSLPRLPWLFRHGDTWPPKDSGDAAETSRQSCQATICSRKEVALTSVQLSEFSVYGGRIGRFIQYKADNEEIAP